MMKHVKTCGACSWLRLHEFRPYRLERRLGLDVLFQIIHLGVRFLALALVTRSLEMSAVMLPHISLPGHSLRANRTDHRPVVDPEMLSTQLVSQSG